MLIEIVCVAGGALLGCMAIAIVASGKISDLEDKLSEAHEYGEDVWKGNKRLIEELERLQNVSDVCAAVSVKKAALQDRIDRALECVTPNCAHVGKKMAKILRGEA